MRIEVGDRLFHPVSQKSFGVATVDEPNKRKLHAVSEKRLNCVAALAGSMTRYGKAVVFLLAGPGLAVLGCCSESGRQAVVWACAVPNRSKEENSRARPHDSRDHLLYINVFRIYISPAMTPWTDKSRTIFRGEVIECPDQSSAHCRSRPHQGIKAVVMMERLPDFTRMNIDDLELGE